MDTSSLESRFSSIIPRVEFIDIQDQYSYNEDLVCRYSLIDYEVQEGDRIAIFKLGWQYVKDYVLFEWVPKDPDENLVTFNKLCLPKSTIEIYQFCFISGENNVHGASEPFQFCDRPKNYQSLFMTSSYKKDTSLPENYKSLTNNSPLTSLSIGDPIDKDKELIQMKEENEFLRNTLKIIVMQNKTKNYDPDIQKLKKITCDLQTNLNIQQSQIKDLQVKVAECNEQYRKLNKEKLELENTCEGLRKKLDNTEVSIIGKTAMDFEIGELESIPPFPFAK